MSNSNKSSDFSFLLTHGYLFGDKICKKVLAKAHHNGEGPLACKVINHERKPEIDDKKKFELLKDFSRLSHPHIVQIHSIVQNGTFTYIFMPWLDEGNLVEHIRRYGMVKESIANLWFYQVVCAVSHIHALKYAHCNLSCNCVMIAKSSVKLSGLHRMSKKLPKSFKTSPCYWPPELNTKQTVIDVKKCDIYALGVILSTMLNAMLPFNDSDMAQLIDDQKSWRYHMRTSNIAELTIDCQAMIHTLLEPNQETRWGIDKINKMKWLGKYVEKQGDYL